MYYRDTEIKLPSLRKYAMWAAAIFNATMITIMVMKYPNSDDSYAESETDADALSLFIDGVLSTGIVFGLFLAGNLLLLFLVVASRPPRD